MIDVVAGIDLCASMTKEQLEVEIARMQNLFIEMADQMQKDTEKQSKLLDDQDLEILTQRFALDQLKVDMDFATSQNKSL